MPILENSRNFVIHGGSFVDASRGRSGIDRLHEHTNPDATHDSYVTESKASCLEGTRTQYIEDITAWTTGTSQVQQRHLLWMYGPAGVGKSAVAKSCAEKTAQHRTLGASFFFSRDNHIDDPVYFFTTIAYQLAIKVPHYKKVVGAKVEADYNLPRKGLETQFNELIIEPFLELGRRNIGVGQWAVFVDGLDECKDDSAQSKIVRLVANSVVEHGDKVPLLWAFFSRPERHISNAFSQYFNCSDFWKVELPVSRSYDADIRLYFRSSLRSTTIFWPPDEIVDKLVEMVAGLFIYAAAVVRFIMDQNALGPQRQLDDVLAFHSRLQPSSTQPNTQPAVTDSLDAFYLMIMGRIPSNLLLVAEQTFLIHHTTTLDRKPIYLTANIIGLTIEELENSLSKLHSVLTFRPSGTKRAWGKPFPGSTDIHFYHASFMEFLLDPERSKEYWIEDQRHYTALAVKGMRLFKELYMMNGIPLDEKIQKLQNLFRVFPDETFTTNERLIFRDELVDDTLYYCSLMWCGDSGLPPKVMEVLQEINLEKSRHFFDYWGLEKLPEEKQSLLRLTTMQWELEGFCLPCDVREDIDPSAPVHIKDIWALIASLISTPFVESINLGRDRVKLGALIRRACKISGPSADVSSQIHLFFSFRIQGVLERAKKLDLDALDDVELLDYYSYAWRQYQGILVVNYYFSNFPSILQAAMSPWQDFFVFIEGRDHRLTKAVCRLLNQKRSGDLVPAQTQNAWTAEPLLFALNEFLDCMSTGEGAQVSPTVEQFKAELFRATEAYYMTVQGFLVSDTLLFNLKRVASHIIREESIGFSGQVLRVGAGALMKDHWDELFEKLEEVIDADEDPDNYLEHIRMIVRCNPNATSRAESILKAHIKRGILRTIAAIEENKMSVEKHGAYAPGLLYAKQQWAEKAERVFYSSHSELWEKDELHHMVGQAYDDVLVNHPVWCDAIDEFLAEQDGEDLRKLFYMDGDARVDPEPSVSSSHLGEKTTLTSDLKPSSQHPHLDPSDNVTTQTSILASGISGNVVEANDAASSSQAPHSTVELNTSSQSPENKRLRKRDKLARFFHLPFKRN